MKIYRTVDDVFRDRRAGTKLASVVETLLHSSDVLNRFETPFEIIQGFFPEDYVDASTTAWQSLPVELQMKYSSAYQIWYAKYAGYTSVDEIDRTCGMYLRLVPPMRYWSSESFDINSNILTEISKPFWVGACEVTQREWMAIMGDNPSEFYGGPDFPVERVSWHRCQEFCKRTGLELPNENLWELACRAGTTTLYSFGDDKWQLGNYAWYEENSGMDLGPESRGTHTVAEKLPNAWGFYDMLGNVAEWCGNKRKHYPGSKQVPPTQYIIRGGSWIASSSRCWIVNPDSAHPEHYADYLGFRVSKPA